MHPLDTLIAQGEHAQQDFKYFLSDARKIARSLAAFANTQGGRLLVGVKDNGRVVGLKHKEEEAYVVEAAAQVFCHPAVEYQTRTWNYEGKTVLEVQIPKSDKAPHTAPDEKGQYVCYLRKADQNKVATELEHRVLSLTHSGTPLTLQLGAQHHRLLSVLETYNATNGYDIRALSRLSLLTYSECLETLAQLIASHSLS